MGKLVRYQLLNVVKYVDNAVKAKKLEALGYVKAPEPKQDKEPEAAELENGEPEAEKPKEEKKTDKKRG